MDPNYLNKEDACKKHFASIGRVYHCCSSENFGIIISNELEFADIMLIVAVCCSLFDNIKMITFQLMNNHFHFVIAGEESDVESFLSYFKQRLKKYYENSERNPGISTLEFKQFYIEDLEYFRSTIAYCNRNGFVISSNYTPYTYPWGANICYFNSLGQRYYKQCRQLAKTIDIRKVFRGKQCDSAKDLYLLDNIVSPFSYCKYEYGEKAFRDAKQYFYYVAKNVESSQKIASIINEQVIYTDEDLYSITCKISTERFGNKQYSLLPPDNKTSLAKILHFEYNAGVKQIQRILKLPASVLNQIL